MSIRTAWALLALSAYQVAAESGELSCLAGQGPDLLKGSTPQLPAKLEPTTDWSWQSCYILRNTRYDNFFDEKSSMIFSDSYNGTWRTCAELLRYWDQERQKNQDSATSCIKAGLSFWLCTVKFWFDVIYCCDSNDCNYRGPPGTHPPVSPAARRPPGPQASQSPGSNFSLLTRPTLAAPLLCLLMATLLALL